MENNFYYNQSVKLDFINEMVELQVKKEKNNEINNIYTKVYERIFLISKRFEEFHGKDLYSFTEDDLFTMLKTIAKDKKYTTIYTYNSLIADYKKWAKEHGKANVVDGICPAVTLKKIDDFEKYLILNDEDIDNLTIYSVIDGADFNCVILIRMLWELNGEISIEDIANIKITDIDGLNHTIIVNNKKYQISEWLSSLIEEFADTNYLSFKNKKGVYKILKATENNGYVLRVAYTKNTKVGEPLTTSYLSNLMYQYSERKEGTRITINDIKMSLALKYMLVNKKTHSEMYGDKKYFTNLPSRVYSMVFTKNAKEKFPELYNQYMEYYKLLKNNI